MRDMGSNAHIYLRNKDVLERNVSEKMCSSGSNGAGEICSPGTADTLRGCLCTVAGEEIG